MRCSAGDLVDARLGGNRVGHTLGERLDLTELRKKAADKIEGSRPIRRLRAMLDIRARKEKTKERMRRTKEKRVVAGV